MTMRFIIAIVFTCASVAWAGTVQPPGVPFKSPVTVAPGFSAQVIFSNLTAPRGIAFDSKQTLLVVERGLGVTAFKRVNNPAGAWERNVVIKNSNLTHGIQVDENRIFVSTAAEVLAYPYDPSTTTVLASPYTVIDGLPSGVLSTHTIQLEADGSGTTIGLLVGTGPFSNLEVEPTPSSSAIPTRSQVRRFVFPTIVIAIYPPPALHWADGQIVATGIRNPAGFAFHDGPFVGPAASKQMYIVENAPSIDNVSGMTTAFANDNPADELNSVIFLSSPPTPVPVGPSFGFPDCATLWNPTADPVGVPQYTGYTRGDQFTLRPGTSRNDTWCQDDTNNRQPSLSFQAHSVPLDIKFYKAPTVISTSSFPNSHSGHAFVSFHGSIERKPPTGYGVVRVPFPLGNIISNSLGYSFLVQAANLDTCPGTCIRPVGLGFGSDGRLYASSDSSGELFVIQSALTVPVSTLV